jgi:hypothetical protein
LKRRIELGGKPEYLTADGAGKVFVNLEDKNQVAVLCGPEGLTLDGSGNLWVAEDDNSRVLEYNDPLHAALQDICADLVYGEPNFSSVACTVDANGVCHPDDVTLGRSGQLLISDGDNNHLLLIDSPLTNTTANADRPTRF